jgi:hypothetical protein
MIEREIPKDISKFETKLAGPFSARQTGCLIVAAGVVFIVYNSMKAFSIDPTLTIFVCFICCLPFVAMGWKKPYGMAFEKFAKHYITYFVFAPPKRKYKSVTSFELYEKEYEAIANAQKKSKKQTQITVDSEENSIVYELPKKISTKHKKSKTYKEFL